MMILPLKMCEFNVVNSGAQGDQRRSYQICAIGQVTIERCDACEETGLHVPHFSHDRLIMNPMDQYPNGSDQDAAIAFL